MPIPPHPGQSCELQCTLSLKPVIKNPLISQGISGLVELRRFELLTSTMRMSRATNCANAPGGFSRCLGSAEEEFSRPISRLVVWGAGWGRKYAYLVLPTVLMPHCEQVHCGVGELLRSSHHFEDRDDCLPGGVSEAPESTRWLL